ncbi:MAG: hypothetical protein HJJLKODD_01449 [Phycisphaerae bacterium]|nr:hypothetical protein [Phycisphaerae bacterium]
MKHRLIACALLIVNLAFVDGLWAQDSQPTDVELFEEIRAMKKRLDELEKTHQEDQKKINELVQKLQEVTDHQQAQSTMQQQRAEEIAELKKQISTQTGLFSLHTTTQESGGSEDDLDAMMAGGSTSASSTGSEGGLSGALSTLQGAIQSFNPDLSLNLDMRGMYSNHEGGESDDGFLFRELELGYSGAVDPYTRADVIVAIGHENTHDEWEVDLEEAYLTFVTLPFDLQARAGKFRAEFGKSNPIHLHALPWTEYPNVIRRFFGGEGLFGTGAEISWLVPNPWEQYLTLLYEVSNNDNDTLFAGEESDDLMHLLRLKSFYDLSPTSTLELGGSVATAPNDHGHGGHRSTVEGIDLTYRWKPKDAGLYRSFLWQNELLFSQADQDFNDEDAWGLYSAAEYQFERQWKFGLRYDNTQLPNNSDRHESAISSYLTFLQSEFVFWRLAYIYTDRNFESNGGQDEHQVMLQLNWTLGAHPAHRY